MTYSNLTDEELVDELARTFNDVYGASLIKMEILKRLGTSDSESKELVREVIDLRAAVGQADAVAAMLQKENDELRQKLSEYVQAKQEAINLR